MDIRKDIKVIRELLNMTQSEFANKIGVSFEVVNRWESSDCEIEHYNIEKIYNFAFSKGIHLNEIYEQISRDKFEKKNNIVLFHGCKKDKLDLPIQLNLSRKNNDFGKGFYLGESFKQASIYIANSKSPWVYTFKLKTSKLRICQFGVDKEWMLAIAYFRGWLDKYIFNDLVKTIIDKIEEHDVIIAPIADNRMFDIISEFVNGEITDLQCEHSLAATNLGYQYVLRTKEAINNLELINTSYVSFNEKVSLIKTRLDMDNISKDKVKVSRIEFRGKGQYIDELLK